MSKLKQVGLVASMAVFCFCIPSYSSAAEQTKGKTGLTRWELVVRLDGITI